MHRWATEAKQAQKAPSQQQGRRCASNHYCMPHALLCDALVCSVAAFGGLSEQLLGRLLCLRGSGSSGARSAS